MIGELEIIESEIRKKLQQEEIPKENDKTDLKEEICSLEKAIEDAVSNLK